MKGKYITAVSMTYILTSMATFFVGCNKGDANLKGATDVSKSITFRVDSKENSYGNVSITQYSDKLGLNIFKEEVSKGKGKNIIISPISIFTALDVLSNGAGGETKKQMKNVMGINSYTDEKMNSEMNKVINKFNSSGVSERQGFIKIYNSLWIDKKFEVKDSFINTSKGFYNSDVFKQEMADKTTKDNMNKWISEKTWGMIKNPISELRDDTVMSIFNVLHFKGKWVNKFKKSDTKQDTFKLSSGDSKKVNMMNSERMIPYYEDDRVKAAVFDYYNGRMTILLPKEDINNFTSKLSDMDIYKYEKAAKSYKTKVKLPVFKVEYKNNLNDVLKEMGMKLPFDSASADFSNLKDSKAPLWLGSVLHNCVVSVDEEGTEAAALTSVMLEGMAIPPEEIKEFYVNKPFIFIIEDNKSNAILFVGKVEKPQ